MEASPDAFLSSTKKKSSGEEAQAPFYKQGTPSDFLLSRDPPPPKTANHGAPLPANDTHTRQPHLHSALKSDLGSEEAAAAEPPLAPPGSVAAADSAFCKQAPLGPKRRTKSGTLWAPLTAGSPSQCADSSTRVAGEPGDPKAGGGIPFSRRPPLSASRRSGFEAQ